MMPLHSIAPSLQSVLDSILSFFDLTRVEVRHGLTRLALAWALVWIGWQLVKRIARRIVAVADDHHGETQTLREKRAQTAAQLLRSAGFGVLVTIALYETLTVLAPEVSKTFGGLGAAVAVAVGFGAQSLLKDYFNGFFILFEGQFVVGDAIEAAGKSGIVEKLTLRTVRLRDIEGTVHIIPNGQITTLSNKTRGWSRAVVDVAISYENDIDRVIATLRDEAMALYADPRWSERFDAPPDILGVETFGENGVTIRVLLRTKPGIQGEVAREFRRRLMIRLERDGVKGARSQQAIHIHQSPGSAAPTAPAVTTSTAAATLPGTE